MEKLCVTDIRKICVNFEIEERLAELDELASKVGADIVSFMLNSFKKFNIDTSKIIGHSYDGYISPLTIEKFSQTEADELMALIPGTDDSLLLFQEFQHLTSEIKECTDMRAVSKMLKSVHLRYTCLARVYEFMLTLQVTVASNERSFSKRKLVKNYLRSTTAND
ncbi:unnamed protein product [Didymodactylos carnosus]|uniref:HAT C-terminal dimerisation domain-containing protein n=1 Tax=Didymodactylos carnosus TaxID=1234261 RepID=A0A813ZJ21_9BILA|nr:unnamed protein product [Didymodactylos carnosus]CAF0899960.1 unnamed protein product [Didymodactylos carnosus]CAF3548112.1 unnamed protein product [Didymodactylos carnosus]CAF3682602.1 unnamed protein product [Didymodactylos carnosus]